MSLRCRKPLPQNNLIYTSNQLISDCPRYWWTHYGHGHVRAIMPCDIETKRLPLELCRPFQFCRHFTLPPVTPPPSPPATPTKLWGSGHTKLWGSGHVFSFFTEKTKNMA